MYDPLEYLGRDDGDEDDVPEFDLGIPKSFDLGEDANLGDLPKICCNCVEVFFLGGRAKPGGKPDHPLRDFCEACLGELFAKWAAEADEHEQLARRLGMTMEEMFGLE